MVFSTKDLMNKYSDYAVPKMKIKNEIAKGKYVELKRGLYEDDKSVDGLLLCQFMCGSSYVSFEYALSMYGIIPERVYTYTCATVDKRHILSYSNRYGNYSYRDVPREVYRFGVMYIEENGYSYCLASKEKALCDLLYVLEPVGSLKALKQLIHENLRIYYSDLMEMNLDEIIELCDLYKKKNHKFLKKYLITEKTKWIQ